MHATSPTYEEQAKLIEELQQRIEFHDSLYRNPEANAVSVGYASYKAVIEVIRALQAKLAASEASELKFSRWLNEGNVRAARVEGQRDSLQRRLAASEETVRELHEAIVEADEAVFGLEMCDDEADQKWESARQRLHELAKQLPDGASAPSENVKLRGALAALRNEYIAFPSLVAKIDAALGERSSQEEKPVYGMAEMLLAQDGDDE